MKPVNETKKQSAERPQEVSFEVDGKRYVLAFDRESVAQAEAVYGISYGEVTSGKTYVIYNLFQASFVKNHPNATVDEISGIWDRMSDKQGLYRALVGLYVETAYSVLEEPDEGNAVSWTTL